MDPKSTHLSSEGSCRMFNDKCSGIFLSIPATYCFPDLPTRAGKWPWVFGPFMCFSNNKLRSRHVTCISVLNNYKPTFQKSPAQNSSCFGVRKPSTPKTGPQQQTTAGLKVLSKTSSSGIKEHGLIHVGLLMASKVENCGEDELSNIMVSTCKMAFLLLSAKLICQLFL